MANTSKISISLPRDLIKFADEMAQGTKTSRSEFIADVLAAKKRELLREAMIEGYKALAEEHLRFAEETVWLAGDIWDPYDEDDIPKSEQAGV